MKIPRAPHAWRLTPRKAVEVQRRLAARVVVGPSRTPLRFVAGLDAAFSPSGDICLAAAVLWDSLKECVVEEQVATGPVSFPYVPGLLSFRELPTLIAALRLLEAEPDVLLCDGQGLAHPRRFGIACHLGVLCDRPAIGCAKSRLIGRHGELGTARGAHTDLIDDGETVGQLVRTQDRVRPVYVSVGHRVSLVQARQTVLRCATRFRLPEPTRLADRRVARMRHEFTGTD